MAHANYPSLYQPLGDIGQDHVRKGQRELQHPVLPPDWQVHMPCRRQLQAGRSDLQAP
jgi:hypothetical protein